MKKLSIMIITVIAVVLLSIPTVFGATSQSLVANPKTAKPGDTVTVVFNAGCDAGLSALETKINYDTEVLTLQEAKIANNWTNYGTGNTYEILSNSPEIVTSLDVLTLTFKVNENAKEGETEISTGTNTITDIRNNEETKSPLKEKITISKGGSSAEPTEQAKITETSKPTESAKEENEIKTTDETKTTKSIPKTGIQTILLVGIIVVVIVSVSGLILKQYKGIK